MSDIAISVDLGQKLIDAGIIPKPCSNFSIACGCDADGMVVKVMATYWLLEKQADAFADLLEKAKADGLRIEYNLTVIKPEDVA